MGHEICTVAEAADLIAQGKTLLLSGDERLLRQLPAGNWIGGTIPYFMTESGGVCSRENLFVTEVPAYVLDIDIQVYDEETVSRVYQDAPDNGFSVIIIPANCKTHYSFALNAPNYEHFAWRPLIGWISGFHLDDLGTVTAKVFDGRTTESLEEGAVVMHVALPKNKVADIGIVNIFEQGDGDVITFYSDGFSATEARVNGQKRNFGEYVFEKKLDKRLPLVADYYGVMINTSFLEGDELQEKVEFYAPVFSGLQYKHARPAEGSLAKFKTQMPVDMGGKLIFSCNCILNYLYLGLDGKKTAGPTGPTTFGEIAYQLLNQTMVYLRIIDLPDRK